MSSSSSAPAFALPAHSALSTLPQQVGSLARAKELLARTGASAWPLGRPELDEVLLGGVPRGRVSEWAGPRSAGKTALLRQLVTAVRETGAGAAYVDGTGTLAPAPWVFGRSGPHGRAPFWVVRPPAAAGVLVAAEELLRSGAFGLVVAEGADWSRAPVVRLQRLARETGAALVAVVDRSGRVPLAGLRVRFTPDLGSRTFRVQVRERGAAGELSFVQDLPYRLCQDAGLPDRRGTVSQRRAKPRK